VFDRIKGERLLSEYVPWADYFADDIVGLNGGGVFMVLAIDGLPFETIDDAVINHRHARLEFTMRDVAQDGLIFHFLQCRGTADPSIYPPGQFHTAFAEQLDRKYRDKLFGTRSMWLNQTFLCLQLSPRQFGGKTINRLLPTHWRSGHAEPPQDLIDRLRRITGILCEELKEYRPRVLGIVKRERRLFSEIAEAVAFAMTGYWRPVPLTTSGASAVFSEPFIVGHEAFEIRMSHRSAWGACLGMHEYPYMTEPGMFDRFLSASYRHTVYHGFRCLPSIDGQALVTRKQNRLRQSGDRALSQATELTTAADLIAGTRMMMGEHAFALTLFADDHADLTNVVQQAWGDLSAGGIKVERESVALEAVLFSMIPGNFHLRGRQAAVSSRNFAAFAAMHNFPLGNSKGHWGDPIAMLRTSGGSPYLFHFHHEGVGNAFISGETGSGKTTIIGFLICQAERAGAQIILWDKDRGLEALVRAMDGSYLSLTNAPGLGSGLAPLKRLTDSPEDVAFLSGLIRACIATPEPYNLTPEEDRRLGLGLRHVMALPAAERCMEEVRSFLGTSRHGAGARLEKWCAGGEFGWVIDCVRDIVELDGRVIGFDQSGLLDDPIASGAVMATLFHYTGKLVDGRRLLFLLDEVWNALLIEEFHAAIHNGLKTWRKYNSPILIATQSVADALKSPIAHTIREQCPTQLHFANPRAVWSDYGPEGMHLTETEFDIVQKMPKGNGTFLLRQGSRSVVVQAPLGGLDVEIAVISGTRRGADALKLARQRTDDATGPVLVAAYQNALLELAQ
jgi:type IV secretion system protein VirB4